MWSTQEAANKRLADMNLNEQASTALPVLLQPMTVQVVDPELPCSAPRLMSHELPALHFLGRVPNLRLEPGTMSSLQQDQMKCAGRCTR